jgi:peptidoglycan/LPS O-acetylase OafA/YrhL
MKKQLNEVYIIRAIASLMVCFFHVCNVYLFTTHNNLKEICSYGYLGVEMFFILTGFVIIYSIPENYTHKLYTTFLLKRITRIEPPYFISIFLVLFLNTLSHNVTGKPNDIHALNILYHLGYLNNFGFGNYISPIYWTLGIEFQFYFLIGFLIPYLKKHLFPFLLAAFLLQFISINNFQIITNYLPFFCLGIIIYFYKFRKEINSWQFSLLSGIFLIQIYLRLGVPEFIISCLTIVLLLFFNKYNKVIKFFSDISFSLYLTHVIIGGKVINLGLRYVKTDIQKYILLCFAIFCSILCAYLFYRLIEKPFYLLSRKIYYSNKILKAKNNIKPVIAAHTGH